MNLLAIVAAAFVAAEGGEELKLFQTTESKDFREIATSGFTIHPYPAVEALDVDAAKEKHEFLALSDVELAYNGSPVTRDTAKPTLISPKDTRHIALGKDNWTRTSEIILDEKFDSEHFYIGEGMIPSGNWSGYPSHRHDVNNPPNELDMEETYFYLFDPPQGFGFQSVYKPDGSLNEAYRVQSYDTVAIAEGYHPLVGAPGYQMYYLWTMAGAQGRGLISSMDPAHAWVKNG